ncbi:MAG: hypothetical protein QM796_13175 [Chthoniobacteraceae bacterium]
MKTYSSLELLEGRIAPSTVIVTNLNDSGAGSLRAAIAGSHNGDVIDFKTGLSGLIHVKSNLLIKDSLSINGGGRITLDGGGSTQLFNISNNETSSVGLMGLTFRNGYGADGGAIYATGSLSITDCVFKQNVASDSGGAINQEGGQLTITGSTFATNSSGSNMVGALAGGAIYADVKSITITASNFSGNSSFEQGGAIWAFVSSSSPGAFTITNTHFDANKCGGSGGAISEEMLGGSAVISGSSFTKNSASSAGALWLYGSAINLSSTQIIGNTAKSGGGGEFVTPSGFLTMTSCKILHNTATDGYGGGLILGEDASLGVLLTLKSTEVAGNTAQGSAYGQGGGIILAGGKLVLDHSVLTQNIGAIGGGIFNNGGTVSNIASIISGNSPNQIYNA